jgi:hypothetical protein
MSCPSCKICFQDTRLIHATKPDIQYYCCNSCDFIFIDDNHLLSAEEETARYRQHDNTLENEGYVSMLNYFIKKSVLPYRDSVKNILDYGCGESPVLALLLKEEGFEVDIYDKFFHPEEIYRDKTYDLITATEVIEHLNNPLNTFDLFRSLLNNEGFTSIMTSFHPQNDQQFIDWWYRRDRTHISFYSRDTFDYVAKKCRMNMLYFDDKNISVLQAFDAC